ncbi:hypothetical protein ACXM5X_35085, partial [Pseudomonas saponiphila]
TCNLLAVFITMTFIESLTLMLALMYLASLSYWSGQKWGAVATLLLSIGAVAMSLYWPLALGLLIALPLMLLGHKFAPDALKGEIKINTLREGTQHVLALSLLLVAIQYTINTVLLKQGITPWLMRPDVV